MASSMPGEQISSVQAGQKRKREDDDIIIKNESKPEFKSEIKNEDAEADDGANVDTHTLVPNNYEPDENDENEHDSDDGDDDNAADDDANHPVHHESDEPFPSCAYYDEATEEIVHLLTSIPERIHVLLEDHNSSSKFLAAHKEKTNELSKVPLTEKIKIAILGGAGAGKSSLLNAVTGKPDLAKSLGSGQSCTCVPTEYHDSFPRQRLDFAASVQYMNPDQIREMLKEILKDGLPFLNLSHV